MAVSDNLGDIQFTDLDYTDDVTLFVDKPELLPNALETSSNNVTRIR